MEAQTDNNNTDNKSRKGRKPSAPRERMEAVDAEAVPLEGGRLTKALCLAKGNGGRKYRLRFEGLWRVTSQKPVTMLEAWLALTGTPPEELAEACGVTANTIRNQSFCPQIVKTLSHETGIGKMVLASNKEQETWIFNFDAEGKAQGSDMEILTEEEKQILAARAGIVLPPKATA